MLLLAVPPAGCGAARAGSPGDLGPVASVATGLEAPWDMALLPDGSALLTKRPGQVRLLTADGRVRREPIAVIPTAEAFTGDCRVQARPHPD